MPFAQARIMTWREKHYTKRRFNKKPKFPGRLRNRCRLCGRPRAYIRKFALCRICFRQLRSWATSRA